MKRKTVSSLLFTGLIALSSMAFLGHAQAQAADNDADDATYGYGPGYGPGMMGGYGPGYGMGPGMMGGYGYGPQGGYGPGMMGGYGQGYGMGPGMMGNYGYGPQGGYGMMGPGGMMGGYGPQGGYGPGMMGGYGPGMMGLGPIGALNLSDDQRSKITQIQEGLRKKNWDLIGKLQEERANLASLFAQETPDPNKVGAEYDRIANLRKQILQNNVQARNQVHALLTPEQHNQLQQWRQGRVGSPGYGGRGMMPSPQRPPVQQQPQR